MKSIIKKINFLNDADFNACSEKIIMLYSVSMMLATISYQYIAILFFYENHILNYTSYISHRILSVFPAAAQIASFKNACQDSELQELSINILSFIYFQLFFIPISTSIFFAIIRLMGAKRRNQVYANISTGYVGSLVAIFAASLLIYVTARGDFLNVYLQNLLIGEQCSINNRAFLKISINIVGASIMFFLSFVSIVNCVVRKFEKSATEE